VKYWAEKPDQHGDPWTKATHLAFLQVWDMDKSAVSMAECLSAALNDSQRSRFTNGVTSDDVICHAFDVDLCDHRRDEWLKAPDRPLPPITARGGHKMWIPETLTLVVRRWNGKETDFRGVASEINAFLFRLNEGSILCPQMLDNGTSIVFQAHRLGLVDEADVGRLKRKARRRKPMPKKVADGIKARDGNRCKVCGADKDLTIDHIIPIATGGSEETDNLWTLCRSCNSVKLVSVWPPEVVEFMRRNDFASVVSSLGIDDIFPLGDSLELPHEGWALVKRQAEPKPWGRKVYIMAMRLRFEDEPGNPDAVRVCLLDEGVMVYRQYDITDATDLGTYGVYGSYDSYGVEDDEP